MDIILTQEKYTTAELIDLTHLNRVQICKFAREGSLKSVKERLSNGAFGYVYKKDDIKEFFNSNDIFWFGNPIKVVEEPTENTVKEEEPLHDTVEEDATTDTVTNETNEEETASSASIITGALVVKKADRRFGFDFTSEKSYDENLNFAYAAMSRLAQNLKSTVTADWNSGYPYPYPTTLDWVENIMKNLCFILTGDFPIDNYRRYLWERTKLEIALFNKQFDKGHQTYGYISPFINTNQKGIESIKIEITDAIIR